MSNKAWPGGPANLEGKCALVTGATRGIGMAIAQMLAKSGTRVVICGQSEASVKSAQSHFDTHAPGKVKAKAADVKSHEQVRELFEFADLALGGLDILVNNAGVGRFGTLGQFSPEDWETVVGTNLTAAFYCTKEALKRFAVRGGGYVVNISSLAGKNAFAGGAAYNASKFGLNGFSEAVMMDARYDNVRVTTVMPGSVATRFGSSGLALNENDANEKQEGKDWKVWPEDVAEMVHTVLMMPARTTVSALELRPSQPKRK